MDYVWHFGIVWDYRVVFLRGAWITALLTLYSTLIGVSLGLLFGLFRSSSIVILRWPAAVYIEFFRATPVLVQLVWIYYSLPILTGL
ncbi:MAG: ABC transporter permease subunit, partial [Oceanibaculum nanhaiense]|nr:ABC transporter permease subunit [Oceanibaculum nanhaiense]